MAERPSERGSIRNDLKIIVIGSSGAGKTSFVTKWTKTVFPKAPLHRSFPADPLKP